MSRNEVSRRGLLTLRLTPPAPPPAYDEAADTVRCRWNAGAGRLFRALEPLAAPACDAAEVDAGRTVLDVGAGDGNVALEAASRGAAAHACEPAPELFATGRRRALARGSDVEWARAGADALPYGDATFDAVVSVLGAALDPRPRRTAAELLRVLRPAGTLVLAVPARRSLTAKVIRMGEMAAPLPPGVRSPLAWSDASTARDRFAAVAPSAVLERREIVVELGVAPHEAWDAFAGPFGLSGSSRDRLADIAAAHSDERWLLLVVRRGAR